MITNQTDNSTQSKETQLIELFISCRQLDDLDLVTVSDPYVILYRKNNNFWIKIDQTEVIWNNLNPNFVKTFQIQYFFQISQHLKMEVHHYINSTQSKIIGKAETTVAEIIGSKNQIFIAQLFNLQGKRSGKIIIKADQIKQCNDEFSITLSGQIRKESRFWFLEKVYPFLRFYRQRQEDDINMLVYETEYVNDMTQIKWKEILCQAQKLCNGNYSMQIKVELWDYKKFGQHKYLGETTFCINELIESSKVKNIFQKEFINKCQMNKSSGILQFDRFQLKSHYTFFDYCAGGQQLSLIIAIDFTASNEDPQNPNSLHYLPSDGSPSQYLQAIISVVEILINYDYDKRVPLYGFGCKPKMKNYNTNQTLHLFPLNDNPQDPEVYGLDGIIECYKNQLHKLQFDGPTYLHPVLNIAMQMAQQRKNQGSEDYIVLLILTDGQTDDMLESIDDIIASSYLPLSVIIIGIGDANFKNMMILDNDNKRMVDSKGNKAVRDLVQFVPFNQFKSDPAQLSKEVLQELPNQLIEYMELVGIRPKPPKIINQFNLGVDQTNLQQWNQNSEIQQNNLNDLKKISVNQAYEALFNMATTSIEFKQEYLNNSIGQDNQIQKSEQ